MSLCWDGSQLHASSWDLLLCPFYMLFANSINLQSQSGRTKPALRMVVFSVRWSQWRIRFYVPFFLILELYSIHWSFPFKPHFSSSVPAAFPHFDVVMPFPCWLMDLLMKSYKETWIAFRESFNPITEKVHLLIKVFHIWNICLLSSF